MRLELEFIAKATGGRILGNPEGWCDGACVDSRQGTPGQLFVALQGEHADGHDFIARALDTAAAALVSHPADGVQKPQIVAQNTLRAFQDLGREACRRLDPRIVAITGSVGKTTAKELILSALSRSLPGVAGARGNLNSRIGVPLSVCNLPDDARLAVLEMGISQKGEMPQLGRMAPPNVILFTGVHPVHTEFFGSLQNIAREKTSLLEFLKPGGTVCFPAADPYLEASIKSRTCRKISFGPGGDLQAVITSDQGFLGFEGVLTMAGVQTAFRVPHSALHLETLLSCAAVLSALDLGPEAALDAAREFRPLKGRLNVTSVPGGLTLVDDSYNASPFAVEALLEKFSKTPVQGKKILVLGDMLELGGFEQEAHWTAGEKALKVVDLLITVGRRAALSAKTFERSGKPAFACDTVDAAAGILRRNAGPGDWVALKASRGMQMERLIPLLEDARAV